MSLTATPTASRAHIGFFGLRNAGKSSLVNALANQSLSIVSPTPGTTTDTVKKAMELLPIGPVVLLDTAGFDDEGELGEKRIKATESALRSCDVCVLVTDAARKMTEKERAFLKKAKEQNKQTLVVFNKCDLPHKAEPGTLCVSARTLEGMDELKAALAKLLSKKEERALVRDLVGEKALVLLVTPIDEAAPKGRIILPQQQTLRELLDAHATVVFCQSEEVKSTLARLSEPPTLVVTDSQAFGRVAQDVPEEIPLTSFSILFARYKGELDSQVKAAKKISRLTDASHVLISEGCTHHRSCGDIGTVKLPAAIRRFSGAEPTFSFTQGGEFPDDLSPYDLVIHCGGCMLNEAEMKARLAIAASQDVPLTNYGMALALIHGILPRALAPFPETKALL